MLTYKIIWIFAFSSSIVSGYRECATITSLQNFKSGYSFANVTGYLHFNHSFPVKCVETCMRSSVCKSVNFNMSSGECQLYHQSSEEYDKTEDMDFIFTDVKDWPLNLARDCSNHTCPNNTICVPDTTTTYTCNIVGCLWTSGLEDTLPSDQPMWEFGSRRGVECTNEYYTTEMAVCARDGSWVIPICKQHAINCRRVKKCNDSYGDGEYWIYKPEATGKIKLIKVYCYNMTSDTPDEFVTLSHDNFATRSSFKYENRENCSVVKWDDGHITTRKMGRTEFYKVGLKIYVMQLYETKYQFANSTTVYLSPYGSGYSCADSMNSSCPALGRFVIDLRNTSFTVSPETTWSKDFSKNTYIQNISFSEDNRVVEGRCGGDCGGCKVDHLIIEINENFQPDWNSAVFPICDS